MMRRAAVFASVLCGLLLLFGCGTYVPEGATVVSVKNSKQEFDRAVLRSENELHGGAGIRMKWYDTNTYITTATLHPGIYRFQAHSYSGGGISRDIKITPDQNLYEIDASFHKNSDEAEDDSAQAGPALKGKLNLAGQGRTPSASVLFIGQKIVMKTTSVSSDGTFTTNFPTKGNWRIEVHQTGNPPRSYVHPAMNVTGPVDLGVITLK